MSHENDGKKIYTSNFARIKQFKLEIPDCRVIATSCWVARWHINAIDEKRLDIAPTWEIVDAINKEQITWEEYAEAYLDLLRTRNVDPHKLVDELPNNSFLLCFEKPTDRCHRFLLADWVYEHTGFKITEWMNKKEREAAQKQDNLDSLLDL